jgi:hypothetical protein
LLLDDQRVAGPVPVEGHVSELAGSRDRVRPLADADAGDCLATEALVSSLAWSATVDGIPIVSNYGIPPAGLEPAISCVKGRRPNR